MQELELDGFIFKDGRLLASESGVIDTSEEEGIILHLAKKLGLPDVPLLKHHLNLSEQHFIGARWDDCIANARKALETILEQCATVFHQNRYGAMLPTSATSNAESVRNYLKSEGLLELKEKDALTRCTW